MGSGARKQGASSYEIRSNSRLNDIAIDGTVNGKPFTAQVHDAVTESDYVWAQFIDNRILPVTN